MDWLEDVLARLESATAWGYHHDSESATEPTALAASALLAHGRAAAAARPSDWLLARQSDNGRLGIDATNPDPGWATALAAIAWHAARGGASADPRLAIAVQRALDWIVGVEGVLIEKVDGLFEDPTMKGWPWVEGTHAWVEPTAMNLLALRLAGRADHPRAIAAVRLLHNRLLSTGGCNYGNTIVLGQLLLPQLQPTGVCLLALGGQRDITGRMTKATNYLIGALSSQTTTSSLCHALLGLAAQGQWPKAGPEWLAAAAARTLSRDPSSYLLALLALAAQGPASPLLPIAKPKTETATR